MRYLYVVLDKRGRWFGAYTSKAKAVMDAWGPRCSSYTVVKYEPTVVVHEVRRNPR